LSLLTFNKLLLISVIVPKVAFPNSGRQLDGHV
jgi:hypothetical protein